MSVVDLLPNADEESLRASLRSLLRDRAHGDTVQTAYDQPAGDFSALSSAVMSDLGAGDLLLDTEDAVASAAAVVTEELGRAVAPVPFLTSAVIAASLVSSLDDAELTQTLRSGGTVVLASRIDSGDLAETAVSAQTSGDGVSLKGDVKGVADAGGADVLLVPAQRGEDLVLVAVEAAQANVNRFPSLDETRPLFDVTFEGTSGREVAEGDAVARALGAARLYGLASLAAEQAGVAGEVFERGIAYIKERRQFARQVGSFQAIKHRAADAWIEVMQLRAAALAAARTLAASNGEISDDTRIAVLTAAAYSKKVTTHVAEEILQFHGGAGMTWEYPIHLYLKRAKANELVLGTREQVEDQLAAIIDIED